MVFKSHITDVALFEEWLKTKKHLAESTIYTYGRSLSRFLEKDPDLENLETYNNFLVEVTIRKRCSHYYSVLKAFIDFKVPEAAVRNKLKDGLVRPKEYLDYARERKYLEENKILEVISYLKETKHRIIALIQQVTGVRAGDIFNLTTKSIVPELYRKTPVLRLNIIGKRKKRKVVFIHDPFVQEAIINYVAFDGKYLNDYYFLHYGKFKNRYGNASKLRAMKQMNYQWYWADLKQALNTANVNKADFATHDFRRCFARRAWDKYGDIHVLQKLLGHSDPKVTLRYLEQSGLNTIDHYYDMQMGS